MGLERISAWCRARIPIMNPTCPAADRLRADLSASGILPVGAEKEGRTAPQTNVSIRSSPTTPVPWPSWSATGCSRKTWPGLRAAAHPAAGRAPLPDDRLKKPFLHEVTGRVNPADERGLPGTDGQRRVHSEGHPQRGGAVFGRPLDHDGASVRGNPAPQRERRAGPSPVKSLSSCTTRTASPWICPDVGREHGFPVESPVLKRPWAPSGPKAGPHGKAAANRPRPPRVRPYRFGFKTRFTG